jgi:hypothetical protein
MAGGVLSARAVPRGHRLPVLQAILGTVAVTLLALALTVKLQPASMPVLFGTTVTFAGAIWMAATQNKPLALAILLLYLGLLDGFLKLRAPVGNELPGLGRDVLVYAIAIGMLVPAILHRKRLELPPMTAWVLAFVGLVLVQLLNPANGSALHSVASLRQHIEFVPLFFIGYTIVRTKSRLRTFMILILALAAVNALVGAVQFNMSPDQIANWGPGYRDLIYGESSGAPRQTAYEGGEENKVRPMALGSDMGFGGVLGGIAVPFALALLMARRKLLKDQTALIAILGVLAVVGVATSQARAAVVGAAVAILAFVALATTARRVLNVAVVLAVVAALSGAALHQFAGEDSTVFDRYSSITPNKVAGTTVDSRRNVYEQALPEYIEKYPFGAGLGTVGPAGSVIDAPKRKRALNAESQFTFTVIELGIAGLVVLTLFNLALLGRVIRRVRAMPHGELRLMLAAIAAPLFMFLSNWVIGVNTTSTPNSAYFWFAAGVLLYWLQPGRLKQAEA